MKWPKKLGPEPELTPEDAFGAMIILIAAYELLQILFPAWGQSTLPFR